MVRDSRKIAAILAADVVDYSRLMGADEAGTLAALAIRRAIFDTRVREFDGRVFGSVGDSLMAEFASAVNAVECAKAIQGAIADENAAMPAGARMRLRIGVNLGDVIQGPDGVAGDAVNVAARLQALAKPGGVLISGAVYDQVHRKVPARYADAGTRRVKNIEEPVRTFEVLPAPQGPAARVGAALAHFTARRPVRIAAIVAAFVAVAGLGLFWRDIPVPATGRTLGEVVQPRPDAPPGSIAVLPFVNMTGDPAIDYLGDGLAEELQHRLSRVAGLRVAARRSAFAFKGKDVDVRGIADALDVSYVVEGSIRRQGDAVRVNASLVDRATGANRWSDSYVSSGDYLSIEDRIGTQVLAALKRVLSINAEAAPAPRPAGDFAAYDFYLQGLSYLRMPKTLRTLDAAEQLFQRSLAKEAGFARAQAGLCQARVERFLLERVPGHVAVAEESCARAQSLDPGAFEVHEAVGSLRLVTGKVAEAELAYRRALEIVPESPDALIGLAAALAEGGKPGRPSARSSARSRFNPATPPRTWNTAASCSGKGARATPSRPGSARPRSNPTILRVSTTSARRICTQATSSLRPRRSPVRSPSSPPAPATPTRGRGSTTRAGSTKRRRCSAGRRKLAPSDHRPWGNLADALLFGGHRGEADRAYARALELAEAELAVNPKHAVNQAQTAYYSSRLRRGDRARQCIAKRPGRRGQRQ